MIYLHQVANQDILSASLPWNMSVSILISLSYGSYGSYVVMVH